VNALIKDSLAFIATPMCPRTMKPIHNPDYRTKQNKTVPHSMDIHLIRLLLFTLKTGKQVSSVQTVRRR
jgi:hypothetical protein